MIMTFKTKRNNNGNIKFLAIDTERRLFSRSYALISSATEATEIKSADYKKLRDQTINAGFTEISYM